MARQRCHRRRAAAVRSYESGPPATAAGGSARKARASVRAARSEPAPEAMRMRSSRSPCSPVAASVHLPGDAGRRQADEERAPAGAANVAGGPVAAVLAAVGEIAPADLLGARAEGGGDGGGVHGAPPARMTAPVKTGTTDRIGEHGSTSLAAAGGTPRSRPLSGSCRRRDGGRCAKREPCRPAGSGSERAAKRGPRRNVTPRERRVEARTCGLCD